MEQNKKIRKSIVCTFVNHAPIRFWGEFDEGDDKSGRVFADYTWYLWDGRKDFGHHDIEYYICKSGKRIYFASYNSGESYGSHEPKTTRTYLKDAEAIKAYFAEHDMIDEWYRICGDVDSQLIVDSDLL